MIKNKSAKNTNSPFGKHHGPHEDQMRKINHRQRRKKERLNNQNWESNIRGDFH